MLSYCLPQEFSGSGAIVAEPISELVGWENNVHLWILQLGCMLLWIMTCARPVAVIGSVISRWS